VVGDDEDSAAGVMKMLQSGDMNPIQQPKQNARDVSRPLHASSDLDLRLRLRLV
jgi:hypothetical protein